MPVAKSVYVHALYGSQSYLPDLNLSLQELSEDIEITRESLALSIHRISSTMNRLSVLKMIDLTYTVFMAEVERNKALLKTIINNQSAIDTAQIRYFIGNRDHFRRNRNMAS
jgi:hypothetical protein